VLRVTHDKAMLAVRIRDDELEDRDRRVDLKKETVLSSFLRDATDALPLAHVEQGAGALLLDLAQPGRVELRVYDVAGRALQTLVDEELDAGRHDVQWQSEGDRGERMPPGVYFYRLVTSGFM